MGVHPGTNRSVTLLLAPHVHRLARAQKPANAQVDGPTIQLYGSRPPRIMVYSVFPLIRDPDSSEPYPNINKVSRLPCKQDLVFSLRCLDKDACKTFELLRITISIPFRTPNPQVPTLMDQYDEVRATMIKDFRFNAVSTLSKGGNQLVIAIVPRAKTFEIQESDNLSFSFVLSGVIVADYTGCGKSKPIFVTIKCCEEYARTSPLSSSFKPELTLKKTLSRCWI